MKRLRRHMNYANTVALLAIVFSLVGTAYARVIVTSANVVDNSLTGAKVKNGTLITTKIESISFGLLRGAKGDTGDQGDKGIKGLDGPVGDKGPQGDAINALSGWAHHDTGLLRDAADTETVPNDSPQDWDSSTYGDVSGAYPGAAKNIRTGNFYDLYLTSLDRAVIALSGIPTGPDYQVFNSSGNIVPSFSGSLSATAQLTFLHKDYDDANDLGEKAPIHNRLECRLSYGNGNNFNDFNTMGIPEWTSTDDTRGIVTMTIAGNASNVLNSNGNYNVSVLCVDADFTGIANWYFVSGNLNVLAAQQ